MAPSYSEIPPSIAPQPAHFQRPTYASSFESEQNNDVLLGTDSPNHLAAPSREGLFRKLSVKLGQSFEDMVFFGGSSESTSMSRRPSERHPRRLPSYRSKLSNADVEGEESMRLVPSASQHKIKRKPLPMLQEDNTRPSAFTENIDTSSVDAEQTKIYLSSWRLAFSMAGIFLALSLTSMESTVVGTAVVPITEDLEQFDMVGWIFSGYLMTFASFLILSARLSDVLGRKLVFLVSLTIFICFSLACGLAQSMTQLIVFRTLQGIGGSGIYSLSIVIIPDLVVPAKRDLYASLNAVTNITMALLGLVVGGLISSHVTWRWIFWLMVPFGVVALVLTFISFPNEFPNLGTHEKPAELTVGLVGLFSTARQSNFFSIFDYIGATLLLFSTAPLLFAIQEGGSPHFPWSSAPIIACLIIAVLGFASLIWYEARLAKSCAQNPDTALKPLLPKTLFTSRVPLSIICFAFMSGVPFYTLVLTLPQRFEIVNLESPIGAAVRLLPLLIVLPLIAFALSVLARRFRLPVLIAVFGSTVVLVIGLAILSTATVDFGVAQYAMEAVAGIGTGPSLSLAVTLLMSVLEKQDPDSLSTGLGAFLQARTLGGTIASAICGNILNAKVKDFISTCSACTKAEEQILQYTPALLTTFNQGLAKEAQSLFGNIFATDLKMAAGVTGLAALTLFGAYEREWVYL